MAKPGIQAEEPVFTFTLEDFLNNKEFVENEIVLTIEGRGANRTSYTNIEEIVRKTAKLSKEEKMEEQFNCYRLEIPNRWYIRCNNQELVEKLNNQTNKGRTTTDGPELSSHSKKKSEVTRVRLLWVPPSLRLGAVRRLAETVFGPEVQVTRPEERRDLSRIDISMSIRDEGEIPYYIPYKKVTEYGKQEEALIMVSLKGRRQRCYHCHSTEHWPNQCSNKMSQRTERTLRRRVEPAPGNVVTGISYARMAGPKRPVHQAAPPPATKTPPAATTSKAPPAAAATKPATEKASPPSKAKEGSPDKPSPPPKPARDSPASPPPAKREERKEEPVEIPAERKDKALSPKKKSPKKTITAEIMKEELEAVKRKAQGRKDPCLAGLYTDRPGKRKAGESPETEKKQETKARRGSRSRSRTRERTRKDSPTK